MNATNGWLMISKFFGNMPSGQIRLDYEDYLFVFEKSESSTKYDQDIIEGFLTEIDPKMMKNIEVFVPSVLDAEIGSFSKFFCSNSISLKNGCGMLKINLDLCSLESLENEIEAFTVNDVRFSAKELKELESFYTETPLVSLSKVYSEVSSHLPGSLHWNSADSLLRYTSETPGLSSPLTIFLKNSFTCIGGPSYNSLTGVILIAQGSVECFGIHENHINLVRKKVQKDYGVDIFDGK